MIATKTKLNAMPAQRAIRSWRRGLGGGKAAVRFFSEAVIGSSLREWL
jgi:hypothetical protein